MSADAPVLDTLADMTAASVEHNSLPPRDFILARLAALIAVDAPPISWFANAAAVQESGLTAEDIQGVMIAVAPVVGAPRVMAAGVISCAPSASLSPWPTLRRPTRTVSRKTERPDRTPAKGDPRTRHDPSERWTNGRPRSRQANPADPARCADQASEPGRTPGHR